jgi:pimeloyl-ACP methyl ester carboxylesterase
VTRTVSAPDGTPIGVHVAGDRQPLVLVHATAADARQWARVLPLLARRFTVMAMDRRGRGASGPLRPDHSLEVEYGDVAAVAASTGQAVHLVGHSSGARFALGAAPRIPRLASLALYEPPAPENVSDEVLMRLTALEAARDREGILRAFFVDAVGDDEQSFASLVGRPVWPLMLDNALTVPAELRAVRDHRFDPAALAELDVPTLLLVGELSDPEVGAVSHELARVLPNATVATLPGQGHGAMFSAPELLATTIEQWATAWPNAEPPAWPNAEPPAWPNAEPPAWPNAEPPAWPNAEDGKMGT